MKKAFAILMSLVLMLSLAVPAMAAETVTNNTNHAYKAYQIFKGTQGEGVALGDVDWGTGIDATKKAALMAELTAEDAFKTCTDAAGVAGVLAGKSDNDPVVRKFAQIVSKYLSATAKDIAKGANSVELDAGYYLLVDQTATSGVTDEVKGLSLLQVTKDDAITITLKTDKPSVDKQVWDETADKDANTSDANWGETADHDIGEEFQFRLTATIPANTMTYFDSYKIIFTDTMSDGITFVRIDSVTVDGKNVDSANYEETATDAANKDGLDWTLTIEDVKTAVSPLDTAADIEVVVTYTAKLNENAAIGNKDDNKNTVGLQYSNNPNVGAGGELGKTTEDTVWVFTYEMNGTKVDGADATKKLANAKFVLLNSDQSKVAKIGTDNKIAEWVAKPAAGNDGKIAWTTEMILTSDSEGKFAVVGLDHGTYNLVEIEAPAGYNLLNGTYPVTIEATHVESDDTATATTTFTVNGKAEIAVENNAGTILPETGGMGTTIFYIVGGVMVAAAVVLLITKKRMSAEG